MLNGFENIPNDLNEKLVNLLEPVLEIISLYGADSPLKSYVIEERFYITGPELRAVIRHLRRLGYPLGSSSKGYYYIHTKDELDKTIEHLEQRKNSIERTILEMRHIQIDKSIQQLNLNMQ